MEAARKNASACLAASGLACRSRTMASSRWFTILRRHTSAARIRRAKFSASGPMPDVSRVAPDAHLPLPLLPRRHLLVEFRRFALGHGQGFPLLAAKMLRQHDDLPDVVGIVRQLPVDGLA